MWLLPLKDTITYYNKVTLLKMIEHLANSSDRLKATNIVGIQDSTLSWWDGDPCVPEYINRIKDPPRQAAHHLCTACHHRHIVSPLGRKLSHVSTRMGQQARLQKKLGRVEDVVVQRP